jgi:hypothetical protein
MDEPVAERRPDVCHRCLQPVPRTARRCPHCGDPLPKANARLILGLFGLAVFVLVACFAILRLMHGGDAAEPPSDADQQQGAGQQQPDGSPQSAPSPPEKKPALGQ